MTTARMATRVLGVLALLLGVVTMHAVAGGHDTHTPGPGLASSLQQMTHADDAHEAPTQAGVAAPCDHGCPSGGAGVVEVCLMVLTAAAFLLLAARAPRPAPRGRPTRRLLPPRRAATRPLRPPSLSVLCISRT